MTQAPTVLHFSGHQYLRHRLVLGILSGKPVRIDKIRSDDKNPGLRGMCSPDLLYRVFLTFNRGKTTRFKSIFSAPFYVYTAKKFPGMEGV